MKEQKIKINMLYPRRWATATSLLQVPPLVCVIGLSFYEKNIFTFYIIICALTAAIWKKNEIWFGWLRPYIVVTMALLCLAVRITLMSVSAMPGSIGLNTVIIVEKMLGLICIVLSVGSHLDLAWLLGRRTYPNRQSPPQPPTLSHWPSVCFQVPTYDEPPELVIQTIQELLKQDYPGRWLIQVIDNNTPLPSTWAPVKEFCALHEDRIDFMHLENWPGYKAGALNEGIRRLPSWVEHIAIIDADYHVAPNFLIATIPHLLDPKVAFVQTPQSYRQWIGSRFLESIYYNYDEYFQTRWPQRAESNGIICVGTMAIIRRTAIEGVGTWDGSSITEDAELSVRLLANGWKGVFDHRAMGFGLMPLDFNGMRKQRFRWALGMVHIFRAHHKILFKVAKDKQGLNLCQRLSFLGLANQFFNELVPFSCAIAVSLVFWLHTVANDKVDTSILLVLPAVSLFLYVWGAIIRTFLTTERSSSHFQLFGSLIISFSISWIIAKACMFGFFSKKAIFLRTPKIIDNVAWSTAFRSAFTETVLGIWLCLLSVWGCFISMEPLAFFCMLLAFVFGSAPAVSLAYLLHTKKAVDVEKFGEISESGVVLPAQEKFSISNGIVSQSAKRDKLKSDT